jgi:hypothetical protein
MEVILTEIKKCKWILFDKKQILNLITGQSDLTATNALFDDLFAFNAYLCRLEGFPSFDKIPYWEYSTCLEWCESHMMVGDSFDLTLVNAKRFLNNIKKYYDYLNSKGLPINITEINKALKIICGTKRLKLVTEIPYTGNELYTEIYIGGIGISFDVADYWLLLLHATQFEDSWPKLLKASMEISKVRIAKAKELQIKMKKADYTRLSDIAFNDITKSDLKQATKWFYSRE